MHCASLISIGNELLIGRTVDTNAAFLAGRLTSLGLPVISCHTVGDETAQIVPALELAAKEADIIIMTGGLGPTDDDLTRQALAQCLGVRLELHADLLEHIRAFFAHRSIVMPERNQIQAHIPAGARPIPNEFGTAPGIVAQAQSKTFVALPGVPSEMKDMFEKHVVPILPVEGRTVVIKRLHCFGAGESAIAEKLGDLMARGRNPLINVTVGSGIITLYVVASADNRARAEQMAIRDVQLLRQNLGSLVFGEEDQTLAEVAGEKLRKQKKTVATAESCTGGLIAKLLTDVSGSSDYFLCGWVTYSNAAKTAQLAVPAALLGRCGAVSPEAAGYMARGARNAAKSDYAIATTGIAGPTGGTSDKPVGLVYIAVASDTECSERRFVFSGDRDGIRLRAALAALNTLRLMLGN